MVEHVEGTDGVERAHRQLELEEVGVEELRIRHVLPGATDLLGGDVDAGHAEPLRQLRRVGRPSAAAELEDGGAVRQPRGEMRGPFAARIVLDPVAPVGEPVRDPVVAGPDDLDARICHSNSTSTSTSAAAASARAAASSPVSPSAIT